MGNAYTPRAGRCLPHRKLVLDLGHRVQVTPSTYGQPDVQCIVPPGGTGKIDRARVLGVGFGGSF